MVKIHHNYTLVFIFKFQKYWIRFIMISNIKLKFFQINLMFELFMCLMLEWLELFLKNLLIRSELFSLKFMVSNFGNIFVVYIFFEFALFFHFFPNKNCQIRKIRNQKNHVGCWLGGGWGHNSTIQTQIFTKLNLFYFLKGKKCKIYSYIIKIIIICCNVFQSYVINHLY